MIVTADKYELPILITNNINDLAKYAGRTKKSIKAALNYKSVDRNLKVKYVRVEYD